MYLVAVVCFQSLPTPNVFTAMLKLSHNSLYRNIAIHVLVRNSFCHSKPASSITIHSHLQQQYASLTCYLKY